MKFKDIVPYLKDDRQIQIELEDEYGCTNVKIIIRSNFIKDKNCIYQTLEEFKIKEIDNDEYYLCITLDYN